MTTRAKSSLLPFIALLLVIVAPQRSAAQTPARWQVFAGYTALNDIVDDVAFPAGWAVSTQWPIIPWLSVAGDVDGQYKTIPAIGSEVHLTSHSVTVGPRVAARLGRFIEFAQVLGGVVQSTGTLFGSTETTRHRVLQPGVGLDLPLGGRWAWRGQLDFRFMSPSRELRVATGIVRTLH